MFGRGLAVRALRIEVGQRFGRLVVIDPLVRKQRPSAPSGRRAVLCDCDCGTQAVVVPGQLVHGGAVSCGCAQREWIAEHNRSHGLTGHPLYTVHQGMMQRCYREGHPGYKNYGARGIAVCDRWRDDVGVFIEDIEREIGPRPQGKYENGRPLYELDRIDNDGNYEPGNVRWATVSEQRRNTRPRQGAAMRARKGLAEEGATS